MRSLLLILTLFYSSFSLAQSFSFEGAWEGFRDQGPFISSHILFVDKDGRGFYMYSLGEELSEDTLFFIDLNSLESKYGFYEIPLKSANENQLGTHLVLAKDMTNSRMNSLTTLYDEQGNSLYSMSWPLHKSKSGSVKNLKMLDFALKRFKNKSY